MKINKSIFTLIILLLSLYNCALCRDQAIKDAKYYKSKGYEVGIATYDMNFIGKAIGAFIWSYHAQAVVYVDNKMYYIDMFGDLNTEPTYTPKRIIVQWSLEEYEKALIENINIK